METSTKIMLLTAMYAMPLCFAVIYRLRENLKLKRKRINSKF